MTTLHIAMALLACMTVAAVGRGQPVVLQTGLDDHNSSWLTPKLSGDGRTIANIDRSDLGGGGYPWFWRTSSLPGIKTRLELPVGTDFGFVNAISHDGRYVFGHVGRSNMDAGNMAIRWNTIDGTYVALPPPDDFAFCTFHDCSDDGDTAVALALRGIWPATFAASLYLWSSTAGFEELPLPDDLRVWGTSSTISGNGLVVVAGAATSSNTPRTMRWTRQSGWTSLAMPPNSNSWMSNLGTSFDGSRIVAALRQHTDPYSHFSVTWDGPNGLPQLPATDSCAFDSRSPSVINFISSDGSRMVGSGRSHSGTRYWLPGKPGIDGGKLLDHMYQQPFQTLYLGEVFGMSADGLTMLRGGSNGYELVTIDGAASYPNMLDHAELNHRWICMHWPITVRLQAHPRGLFCNDPQPAMQWYRYRPGTNTPQPIPDMTGPIFNLSTSYVMQRTIAGRYFFRFGDLQTPDYHVGCLGDYVCSQLAEPNMEDLFGYLNNWFAGDWSTDMDDDGIVQVLDVYAFINEWFRGCEMTTP